LKKAYLLNLDLQTFGAATLEQLQQDRAAIYDQQKALINLAESENREFTPAEEEEFQTLENEFSAADEAVKKAEKQAARSATMVSRGASIEDAPKPFRPAAVAGAPVQSAKKNNGGFESLGEMIDAIRFGDKKGRLNELPRGEGQGGGIAVPEAFQHHFLPKNEFSFGTGEDGGYALPATQFRPEILQLQPQSHIVRQRATVIPAGDPPDSKVTMPALDQGSNGVYGGVEVAWIEEGGLKPETDIKLKEITLEPHEVAATMTITDKLLRNWKAADSFIRSRLSMAMRAAEDIAFLSGDGAGKPLGVLNAPGALEENRAKANEITYLDTLMMLARLLPEQTAGAVWVASQTAMPQIATLQDPAGNYIFIRGDATKGIPNTLSGIPIVFTGKTPTLGKRGDLMLLDLSYYLIKDGSGPFISASEHVYFRNNKTVIKAFWNVDGKPWVIEPLTLEDGETEVSPYVILDVPSTPGGGGGDED